MQRAGGLGDARGSPGGSLLLGVERLGARGRRVRQLRHVPEPSPLGQQPVLVPGVHPLGARDELGELRQALGAARGRSGKLVAAAASRDQPAPGPLELGAATQLLLADEGVQDVELMRGSGEAALLELAGHREQPLDERREVLTRDGPAPRVRARSPVREHPPRGDEPLLPGRPQLGDGLEPRVVEDPLWEVELGLDVRLLRPRAEVRGVAGRAEQEPDRLRQDRLPGAGLAGDRVQPGREGEVGLADEDEVLDAQTAEHGLA